MRDELQFDAVQQDGSTLAAVACLDKGAHSAKFIIALKRSGDP